MEGSAMRIKRSTPFRHGKKCGHIECDTRIFIGIYCFDCKKYLREIEGVITYKQTEQELNQWKFKSKENQEYVLRLQKEARKKIKKVYPQFPLLIDISA